MARRTFNYKLKYASHSNNSHEHKQFLVGLRVYCAPFKGCVQTKSAVIFVHVHGGRRGVECGIFFGRVAAFFRRCDIHLLFK